jgi:hypothetical protein
VQYKHPASRWPLRRVFGPNAFIAFVFNRLQTVASGEHSALEPITLVRELLFLSSHTVYHFALLAPHCRAAGIEPKPDFGKAPTTRAFGRMATA